MGMLLAWLRIELRRRWRSLLVLALLIGISSAAVFTAIAGARRGNTVTDRLLEATLPPHAYVVSNDASFDWAAVRGLPEVQALATFAGEAFTADGVTDASAILTLPIDRGALRDLDQPVMIAGRLTDPTRPDEAVVTSKFVDTYGKGLGDTVTVRLNRPETMDAVHASSMQQPVQADGPAIETRIVGVIRNAGFADEPNSHGVLLPSPGLYERYPDNVLGRERGGYVVADVRLHDGSEGGIAAFRESLIKATGRPDIEVTSIGPDIEHDRQVLGFEAAALLACGLAVALAAIVLVGQAVARYASATAPELRTLRAIGMTPAQGVLTASAGPVLAGVVGAALAVGAAIVVSRWTPFGVAAYFEPSPGVAADWPVLGIGAAAVCGVVAVIAAVAARTAAAAGQHDSRRASSLARAATRAGLPAPVVVGTRFALEPGRDGGTPVRPALVGAVVGVLGVLAAFTFATGVSDAGEHPERFGLTAQLVAYLGGDGQDAVPAKTVLTAIAGDPDVAGVTELRQAPADTARGSVLMFSYDPVGPPTPIVVLDGRLPSAADETALGPTTAKSLGVGIGDSVTFTGDAGSRTLRVTGTGFLLYDDYDVGAWVNPAGFEALFTGFRGHLAGLALRPGSDAAAAIPRLQQLAASVEGGQPIPIFEPAPQPQLADVRAVGVLPTVLGCFLALLAVGAVGHALATVVRRRRREVAVLRALGMTRRQTRTVLVTQATVLAGIGLVFGVPLGIALGRTLWRLMSDYMPLQYVPPLAFWALVLVVPLALLIANLLAALPGRWAGRLSVHRVLRAE